MVRTGTLVQLGTVVVTVLGLWVGARLLVDAVVRLARRVGLPELAIGLTVVAMGTSTPELVVTTDAAVAGLGDIAVANVLGSNVYNVAFILGTVALVRVVPVTESLVRRDGVALLAGTLVGGAALLDLAVTRVEGGVLVALFVAYTAAVLVAARANRPDRESVTPDADPGTDDADRGTDDADRGTDDADRGTDDADRGTGNADSGTRDADSGTRDADMGTGDADSGTRDADMGTDDADRGTDDADRGTGNADSGTRDADMGTDDADMGTDDADSGTRDAVTRAVTGRPSVPGRDVALLVAGLAVVLASGHYLVEAASALARGAGVSEWVVGGTVVAAGTSTPEFAVSLVALRLGSVGVSVGNVVGSNVFNLVGIMGLAALLRPLSVGGAALETLAWLVGVTVVVVAALWTGRVLSRPEGGLLVGSEAVRWTLGLLGVLG